MGRFVEGEDRRQSLLLPESLDDYVTEDNPVRVVEVFIDELDLGALGFASVQPAATGRPAYHPSTLLKIYLYGYLNRVQSSRRLEREAQRNIELMWLTGRLAPDFKTIANFRRDNGPAIRAVCGQFIELCRRLNLFAKAVVAIDDSKFKAVNNRDKNFTVVKLAYRWFCRLGPDGDVPDHSTFSKNRHGRFRDCDLLRELFETVVRRCMAEGLVGGEGFAVDASLIKADANRQRCVPGDEGLPREAASRAIDEYLAVLDDAAFGAATTVTPKFISPADPASRWTEANKGLAFFAYATNYLIDLDLDHAVIVDVEPSTTVRQAEVTAAQTMIERVHERHDLWPERLAADTAYGSAEMLNWLVHERGIEPHIAVIDKSVRDDGTLSRSDFTYDHGADRYRCPGGKVLQRYRRAFAAPRTNAPSDDTHRYRESKADCDACSPKSRCCPNTPARKVTRSILEGARDFARDIAKTDAYVTSRRERKKVEMLFAHLKRILKLDRLRLRGPCGARDEFLLAATAQNIRKLAKLIPPTAPAMA